MAWARFVVVFVSLTLIFGSVAVVGDLLDEDRGHLIFEKVVKTKYPTVGKNVTIQLGIYNSGQGSAFQVEAEDTEYSSEDFEILSGGTKITIDKLESGESSVHELVLKPKRSGLLLTKPASISYLSTYNAEVAQTGFSTSITAIEVLSPLEFVQSSAVMVGAYVSLGYCKTAGDWMRMGLTIGAIVILYVSSQLYSKARIAMEERKRKNARKALGVE